MRENSFKTKPRDEGCSFIRMVRSTKVIGGTTKEKERELSLGKMEKGTRETGWLTISKALANSTFVMVAFTEESLIRMKYMGRAFTLGTTPKNTMESGSTTK